MKTNKSTQIKSLILLIIVLFQLIYPTSALALADSPNQPEFEAYEEFNSTDMVNLITGDFTYNIPLLNVPSPEGGYQIPLSYHAGIEQNEESSWVGLGWNINAGVLGRNISMYPDDYSGEQVTTSVTNAGGAGYIKSYPFYSKYYDSKKGTGGTVDLFGVIDFGWKSQKHVGIAPLGLTLKDGKVTYDAEYMAKGITSTGLLAMSVFGGEAGSIISTGYDIASTGSSIINSTGSNLNSSINDWTVKQGVEDKGVLGIWGKKTYYKYHLDKSTTNAQYGTLYLQDMDYYSTASAAYTFGNPYYHNEPYNSSYSSYGPSVANRARVFNNSYNTPSAAPSSDMYMAYENDYATDYNPTSLTYDNYNVKAPGASGNISPYRLEVGSLCNPEVKSNDIHTTYVGPKYLPYHLPFKYNGDNSNSYTYHAATNNITSPGLLMTPTTDNNNVNVWSNSSKTYVNYPALSSGGYPTAYNSNYNPNSFAEANRYGLSNLKLVHGRHVEWFSNNDITQGYAAAAGFIDSHQNIINRSSLPSKGIGGFSVTNESGVTYHFSIPVYNKNEYFLSKDNSQSPATYYTVSNNNPYATMWLLTGITGPDYVDRGTNGKIDDQDWGYWVKFDYGKFASNYAWRNPYWGKESSNNFDSYKRGEKETYYLDKISTRTHTALFVKSLKNDGKSYYESDNVGIFGETINTTKPSSSLKLDDIYVLENSDYQKLISTGTGGLGLTNTNTSSQNTSINGNGDTYNNVLDNYDLTNPSTNIPQFLSDNQIEKIHFNYTYQLCINTYNSFLLDNNSNPPTYDCNSYPQTDNLSGKLTLKSIDFKGKNDSKIMPGYDFEYCTGDYTSYDTNPPYWPTSHDEYGMSKLLNSTTVAQWQTGILTYNSTKSGGIKEWELTKITTPLGGEIKIEYERDDYSSVNGFPNNIYSPLTILVSGTNGYNSICADLNWINADPVYDYMSPGDVVKFTYVTAGGPVTLTGTIGQFGNGQFFNTSFNIPSAYINQLNNIKVYTSRKYGGQLRVKSITNVDENNNEYVTKYIYTKNGLVDGESSGVASFETKADRRAEADFDFYKLYEHPYSPILYSYVTVINGKSDNTFKELSKQVYHFVTPNASMISCNKYNGNFLDYDDTYKSVNTNTDVYDLEGAFGKFRTVDKTSAIGNLDTVKVYNQFNNMVAKTVFDYSYNENNEFGSMGNYTESTFLWEKIMYKTEEVGTSLNPKTKKYYKDRVFESYKLKRPNILKSVTTYKDRLVSKQQFTSYDYLTARPLITQNVYGNQEKYETEVKPAYNIYPTLGSKALSTSNKNMMVAPTEQYEYVYDKNNQKQLLNASVITYSSNNNYREYNTTSSSYQNQVYSTFLLPRQTYNFKSKVEENGTINTSDFIAFNRSLANQPQQWVKTSEIEIYDHYSRALQTKDINNKPTSIKYGYNNSLVIGACENTPYVGWCFSGAEDKSDVTNYFCGEVKGSNTQYASSTYAHTGSYCCKLTSGVSGFNYKIKMSDLPTTGKYRASVWIHQNGFQGATLFCRGYNNSNAFVYAGGNVDYNLLNNTSYFGGSVEQAGNWYLYTIDADLAMANSVGALYLEFGVENSGGPYTVYADDFRVHPLNSGLVTNVYDPKTFKISATLDKENYATKFYYDNSGKLSKIYKETKQGFTKVSQTTFHYKR